MAIFTIILNIINLVLLIGWIGYGIYMTVSRNNKIKEFMNYRETMRERTDHLHTQIETLKSENALYKNQRDFYHDLLEKERELKRK